MVVQAPHVDRDLEILCAARLKARQSQEKDFFTPTSCQDGTGGCCDDTLFHFVLVLGSSGNRIKLELRLGPGGRGWNMYQLEMRTGCTSHMDDKNPGLYARRFGCDGRSRLDLELDLLARSVDGVGHMRNL
jgi:hypothetical protein